MNLMLDKFLLFIKSVLNFILNKTIYESIGLISNQPIPKSVNYHFTRKCNYECGFCFHTAKTSYMMNLKDAKHGLKMLKLAGIIFLM